MVLLCVSIIVFLHGLCGKADVPPTGNQEGAGLIPAGSDDIFRRD